MSAHRILAAMKHLPRKLALIWRVARECSPDRRGRTDLALMGLYLYAMQAYPDRPSNQHLVRIRIADRVYPVALTHFGDFSSLDYILAKGMYDSVLSVERSQVRHIIDIGAHIGISTLYWHTHFPDASISAFEPTPQSFWTLQDNAWPNCAWNSRCWRAAITGEGSQGLLHVSDESQSNRLVQDWSKSHPRDIQVPTVPLKTVLIGGGALVCFNCEDSEYEIFPALAPDAWAKIRAAVGIIHRTTPEREQWLLDLFAAQGFDVTVHRAPEPCQQFVLTAVRPKETT